MKEFILTYLDSLYTLLNAMSVYILFGLLVAGILKQIVPADFVRKNLGANRLSAIFKSALLGIPIPLCSCSVLPFATALKKDGASKSAVQTFLISTPITGVDSIFATYGAFGWIFTIFRVVSSIIISLIAGILTLIFDNKDDNKKFSVKKPQNFSLIKQANLSMKTEQNKTSSCCSDEVSLCCENEPKEPFLKRVYEYAFVTLLKDIAKPFLIGVFVAAFISTFLPNSLPDFLQNSLLLSYIVMVALSLPLYVCATASIPIGISFILAGFSPGAAFIFLTAGPASNAVTILMVKKLLGTKSLFIYLISIFIGSILFGYLFDILFQNDVINTVKSLAEHESRGGLELLSSIILLILSIKVLLPSKKSSCGCH